MRQRRGVRCGVPALLARYHQTFALQQRSDGAGRRPGSPWLVALQNAFQFPRPPAHVRLPQLQDHLLEVCGRLVAMPVRGTAVLHQSVCSGLPVAPQPNIAGLARDLIPLSQLGHRSFAALVLKYKPQLLFHHTARFPWHGPLPPATTCHLSSQCQECPRSILSGMRPVCTPTVPPAPPPPPKKYLRQTAPLFDTIHLLPQRNLSSRELSIYPACVRSSAHA